MYMCTYMCINNLHVCIQLHGHVFALIGLFVNTDIALHFVCYSPLPVCVCSADPSLQFKDFIYLTQVVQGICMKAEAEHYRRLLSESGAYTRGTLYWQLVGTWGDAVLPLWL